MAQIVNTKYRPLFKGNKRYYFLMGGRGAGRSYGATQYITARLEHTEYFRCAVMRFVAGDIRNSIFQDIMDRIEETGKTHLMDIKEHQLRIKCGRNMINGIGFRKSSSDQKSKLKSLASYNCVVIEEADEISEEDFLQLDDSLRTTMSNIIVVFLLNTPPKNHWIVKRYFNLEASPIEGYYKAVLKESYKHNSCYIFSTYLDNIENLNRSTILNFENYKATRPDHYWNMIMGLVSEGARGRIFKNWKVCTAKEFEELEYPVSYGLDFGFTNDPTALVAVKTHNNRVWTRLLMYETGLTNQAISERMTQLGVSQSDEIYADSAEPKSIAELQKLGWNILPADKGQDSVSVGIDMLLDKEVFYTEDSEFELGGIATEVQNYKWALDKNKEPTNTPVDEYNHAMDALRYNVYTKSNVPYFGFA